MSPLSMPWMRHASSCALHHASLMSQQPRIRVSPCIPPLLLSGLALLFWNQSTAPASLTAARAASAESALGSTALRSALGSRQRCRRAQPKSSPLYGRHWAPLLFDHQAHRDPEARKVPDRPRLSCRTGRARSAWAGRGRTVRCRRPRALYWQRRLAVTGQGSTGQRRLARCPLRQCTTEAATTDEPDEPDEPGCATYPPALPRLQRSHCLSCGEDSQQRPFGQMLVRET